MAVTNDVHDQQTLAIAKAAFEEACARLPPDRDTQTVRGFLAECILKAAAAGEKEPERLSAHGLSMVERAA
jgi:hypothetical protein